MIYSMLTCDQIDVILNMYVNYSVLPAHQRLFSAESTNNVLIEASAMFLLYKKIVAFTI